jgi:murein DD-endopeptidase MepM/ murein hydrolase activator NlpD
MRTTRSSRFLVVPLLALLLLGALVAPPAQAQEADGTELKAQYDEVLDQEAELERAADELAERRAELVEQIAGVQVQLDATRDRLSEATRALQAAIRERDARRAELRRAQRRLERATDQLHAQAVSGYVAGGTGHEALAALISRSDDVSATGRTLSYANAVVDHQERVITEHRRARRARNRIAARAEAATEAATEARDALEGVEDDLEAEQRRLLDLVTREDEAARIQELALQDLRSRKVEIEARVVSLEKESDGIGTYLAEHQAEQPDYVAGSIRWAAPLEEFRYGSHFGMRVHPILHYERLHAGADLSAPSGTEIRAAANGRVLLAEPRGGYGNAVVLGHGQGIATLYAHQSRILVEPGDKVKKGDVIGLVGSTGLSTGPHLHFETRVRGVPVDPENFIDLEEAADAARPAGR